MGAYRAWECCHNLFVHIKTTSLNIQQIWPHHKLWLTFIVITGLTTSPLSHSDEIKIAVRAHSGEQKAIEKWQPTADYLSQAIPEHSFTIVPIVDINQLNEAASRNDLHFALTNPSSYVNMEVNHGASRILTLSNKRAGKGYTRFGSVIFTRSNRKDIQTLQDLRNKSFIAVEKRAFGGWRVAKVELLQNNIDPSKDFSFLKFANSIQEEVVKAVLNGEADAGSVRTDMLERMADAGDIKLTDFKVLGNKTSESFPFYHSTALYPEWPFAKLINTSDILAKKVAIALLQLHESHPAAKQGQYVGWTVPLDYQPVHDLLKTLREPPYSFKEIVSTKEVLQHYFPLIITIAIGFIILTIAIYFVLTTNRRLTKSKNDLKAEIQERKSVQQKLNYEQRFLTAILDNIQDGIVACNEKGILTLFNPATANFHGLPQENLPAEAWADHYNLYLADGKTSMTMDDIPLFRALKGEKVKNIEMIIAPKSGKRRTLLATGQPLFDQDDNKIGAVVSIHDITEQKKAEAELLKQRDQLEDMVNERTAKLLAANRELESYSYSIAHDLRSPLRSVTSYSQILFEDASERLTADEKDSLQRIISAGKYMAQLITDILDLSRITRTSIQLSKINLSKLAQTISQELEKTEPERQVKWNIEKDIFTLADERLIRLLLENLLGNAWKYSRRQNQANISFNANKVQEKTVYCISDNGIGFDNEYTDKLFKPFQRLAPPKEYEGTGVGLASVARIVEKHGGTIWANGEVDQGASFYFTLSGDLQ